MLSSDHDPTRQTVTRFALRVHPGSRVPRLTVRDGVLEVYVRSPARDGRATVEARAAIAEALGVAISTVTCVHGERTQTKLFAVTGDDGVRQRLADLVDG